MERRGRYQIRTPHIALFIDGLDGFGSAMRPLRARLRRILSASQESGIHLLLAQRPPLDGWLQGFQQEGATMTAKAMHAQDAQPTLPGLFEISHDHESTKVRAAWSPVLDLQRMVARIRAQGNEVAYA